MTEIILDFSLPVSSIYTAAAMGRADGAGKETSMRMNRIKPENEDIWHHCYNRVSGTALDRPLGPAEKEKFIRILLHLSS